MRLQRVWGSTGVRYSRQPKDATHGLSSHRIPELLFFTFQKCFFVTKLNTVRWTEAHLDHTMSIEDPLKVLVFGLGSCVIRHQSQIIYSTRS
jgi:hypothetical protein